jgi:hypothetical protein
MAKHKYPIHVGNKYYPMGDTTSPCTKAILSLYPDYLAKWLPRLFALNPLFYTAATRCSLSMHSHFTPTYMYILPQLPQLTRTPAH